MTAPTCAFLCQLCSGCIINSVDKAQKKNVKELLLIFTVCKTWCDFFFRDRDRERECWPMPKHGFLSNNVHHIHREISSSDNITIETNDLISMLASRYLYIVETKIKSYDNPFITASSSIPPPSCISHGQSLSNSPILPDDVYPKPRNCHHVTTLLMSLN